MAIVFREQELKESSTKSIVGQDGGKSKENI